MATDWQNTKYKYLVRDWRGRPYSRHEKHLEAQHTAQRLAAATNRRAQAIEAATGKVIGNYRPGTVLV